MSNKDRWSALSMSERAAFIKRAVSEGITERKRIIDTFNSLAGGGNTNSTESIPRSLMSKEEYLEQQRQETVNAAIQNSYDREFPEIPYVLKFQNENEWRKHIADKISVAKLKIKNAPYEGMAEIHKEKLQELENELAKGYSQELCKGPTCIYTTTGNFGKQYQVSGNRSFRGNPAKYGFVEIGLNEIKPGDVIQDFSKGDGIPTHAVMFVGYDNNNKALFNYSDGRHDESAIKKDSHYPFVLDEQPVHLDGVNNDKLKHSAAAYRFVGTKDDNDRWNSEYTDYRQSYEKDWLDTAKKVQNIVPTLLLEAPQSTIITTSKKAKGGRILDGETERVQTLSGFHMRSDTLPFKGAFNPEDTMFWSPSESARVDSTTPLVLAREEVVATPSQEDIDNILNGPKYSVPKGNAENVFVRKANEIIRDKTESDLRKELNSKNEDEIREVQRSLANEGYFDIDLTAGKSSNAEGIQKMLVKEGYLKGSEVDGNIGSHTTEMLQKMLVDKGYLPEFTESGKSNIDGDIGKRTREAFKQFNRDFNVDGIAGEKTTAGYLAKEGKKSLGFNMKVSAEGMVDQCAAWVSKKYDSVVGMSKQNGVYGSAWNMLKNVEDSGGQMLFNAYDSPYFDNVKDASGIKRGVVEYMKSNPIDYSILEAGDVVGIHNPSSTHYGDVLKEGTTYNTHVGIVVGVENGVPIVEHNILGKVRRERIDKLTGSAFGQPTVTVASRPKKGAPLEGQLEFNDVKSKIELPSKPNEQMSEYMDSVASSKETFGKIYKDVDMDFIEKAAIAITKRETGFMTNKQSDVLKGESGIMSMAAAAARKAAHWWRGTPEEVMSQDLTKMKFASLSSQYRKAIGLETPDQLSTDPTITGRAVTLLLSKNYDYFQRLAKKHPELGLTKEDIQNATIWSYNVGLGALASLGFEGSGEYKGEARPKEIERLRAISQPGYKEKDIRATNWKHLGALGEYMYDNFGDPHTPYVAAANETIARLGTKMMYGGTKSTFKSIAERNARKLSSKTLK